jgi:hypothetical protein
MTFSLFFSSGDSMEYDEILRYIKTMNLVKRMLMDVIKMIEVEENELITEIMKSAEKPAMSKVPIIAAKYPKPAREIVLSVMEPGKEYTPTDIKRLISEKHGMDMPISTVHTALHRLVNRKKIKRAGRGLYQLA